MNRREAALDAVPTDPIRPYGRSLADFEPLKPAERKLLEASRFGEVAVISEKRPDKPTDDNKVRAAFLRFLLLGGDGSAPVHEQGARLSGAWIEGLLDLERCDTVSSIDCKNCEFDRAPVFRDSRVRGGVYLDGSYLPGLVSDRAKIDGGMHLRNGFNAVGEVWLLDAQIGGNLDCDKSSFDGGKSDALSADRTVVKGGVFLSDGFKATGGVRLLGAQIDGDLACRSASFDGKGGDALSADRVMIKGSVFLDCGFNAVGEVRLLGAQIGGTLECRNASFDGRPGHALSADRAVIKGGVFLNNGFKAAGEVRLLGADIGRNLECSRASFDCEDGNALSADGGVVAGSVFLDDGFKAVGGVRLLHALTLPLESVSHSRPHALACRA